MARGKNKRTRRPIRRRPRQQARQRNVAISMRLMRAQVPADPPVRTLTHEHAAVIRIILTTHTANSRISDYGKFGEHAKAEVKSMSTLRISLDDVEKLIIAHMGYADGSSFEINIRKVSAWGPITSGELDPRLALDLSDITGGILVSDKGSPNHRARMGVSSPFNLWQKATTTDIIQYQPNTSSGPAGLIDISVAWRRYALS